MIKCRAALVIGVAGVLLVAACGGDDDDNASSSAPGATSAPAATSPATAAAGGAATSPSTGASTAAGGGAAPTTGAPQKADSSQPPVVVGFHNLEGGVVSLPEIREGFESGLNYVNEELGGINGRPLKAETCNVDVTPESSVNCANQFVEKNVVAAVQGVDIAADAALPVLKQADLVELGFYAFSSAMNNAVGDAYFTLFSQDEGNAAALIQAQRLGATKISLALLDAPAAHSAVDKVINPTAEKLGLDIEVFYYPQQVDWTTEAATMLAANPDYVIVSPAEEAVCLGAVPALRTAGFTGYIHASECTQIIDQLDATMLEKVITHQEYYTNLITEIPPKPQQDLDIYTKYIERDCPDCKSAVYTQLGFHTAVQVADMLRQIPGELTPATVKAGIPETHGSVFFRDTDQTYDCGNLTWPDTTACGSGLMFAKITEDKMKELFPDQPVDASSVRPPG